MLRPGTDESVSIPASLSVSAHALPSDAASEVVRPSGRAQNATPRMLQLGERVICGYRSLWGGEMTSQLELQALCVAQRAGQVPMA